MSYISVPQSFHIHGLTETLYLYVNIGRQSRARESNYIVFFSFAIHVISLLFRFRSNPANSNSRANIKCERSTNVSIKWILIAFPFLFILITHHVWLLPPLGCQWKWCWWWRSAYNFMGEYGNYFGQDEAHAMCMIRNSLQLTWHSTHFFFVFTLQLPFSLSLVLVDGM